MRLLEGNRDGGFSLTKDFGDDIPRYAILSHTWGADTEEVTFSDLMDNTNKSKAGYDMIRFCGEQARRDGLKYFWVDTCCINKSNSTELAEAINSMFHWYQNSAKCYVYLADVSTSKRKANHEDLDYGWESAFRASRWFTRGWTLQELLAPRIVEFFSQEGERLGDKRHLGRKICEISGIAISALQGAPLQQFSIRERLSWARTRQTSRKEDEAYSLLGIFDVYMPLIYGEGRDNAFLRLHEEISKPSKRLLPNLATDDRLSVLTAAQREMFMKSLRFNQIDARHATIKTAHAKTCKWLLKKFEYQDWLDDSKLSEHHGFLWIKGKPATGKSTMIKFAYTNAKETMGDTIVISFFFNARGEYLEKSTLGMYRSLLFQLLERLPDLQDLFKLVGSGAPGDFPQWHIEMVKTIFSSAIENLGRHSLTCFIDALDECEEDEVREMIAFLEYLGQIAVSSQIRLRICFSSRHYPTITVERGLQLSLERQKGHHQDIANYLHSELKAGSSELVKQIKEEIIERASGIFLWVVLVVQMLNKEYDRGRIYALRKRLDEIPNGLDELFQDILTRDTQNIEELILCLQWLLYAKRPLKREELYFAVLAGVAPEALSAWNPEDVSKHDMERFVLNSAKGLSETTKSEDETDGTVQFIHESVRDFFLKGNGLDRLQSHLASNFPGLSHERLKVCCQTYMDIGSSKCWPDDAGDVRQVVSEEFPFLEYATRNILYHADAASGLGISQDSFLENFLLKDWVKLDNLSFDRWKIGRHTTNASLLYILAEQNLPNLISIELQGAQNIDLHGEWYGFPSHAALANQNEIALRALLKPETEHYSHSGKTMQHSPPILKGHWESINVLLQNWSGISSHKHQNLLSWAAQKGQKNIVKLLLETGKVDIDSKDEDSRTPLLWAAQGDETIFRLLLETGKVDINWKDKDGRTPLSYTASGGHQAIAKLLIETGKVDINSKDEFGETPLSWAAGQGHGHVLKLLLETGKVEINSKNQVGETPLSWAAGQGHKDVVRLLLETGKVDINSKNDDGETPLVLAVDHGHKDIAKLLFETGKVEGHSKEGTRGQPRNEADVDLGILWSGFRVPFGRRISMS